MNTADAAVSEMAASIETATWRDLNSLRQIEKECFPKDAWPLLDLVSVLTFPGVIRLKAVAEGQMVGFVAGDVKRMEGIAWIATIAVLPKWQGRGIGSELLRAVEEKIPLHTVRLCVRPSNQVAIHMYEGFGYRTVGEWSKYYQDGEAALVMEKKK